MTTGQMAIITIVTLFAGYLLYRILGFKTARREIHELAAALERVNMTGHEAVHSTLKNTAAVHENTELLREQIILLKELLEKQNRSDT
jgi:hypothetical protein